MNIKRNDGRTALWMAAQEGHAEIVKLLIHAKADVKTVYKGKRLLDVAAKNLPLEIAILLMYAGAEFDSPKKVWRKKCSNCY